VVRLKRYERISIEKRRLCLNWVSLTQSFRHKGSSRPPNHYCRQSGIHVLSHPVRCGRKFLWFCHNARVRQTDRQRPSQCLALHYMQSHSKKLAQSLCAHCNTGGTRGGDETYYRIVIHFCTAVGVADLVTHAKFSNHPFRGFRESVPVGVEFHTFPLNCIHLRCRP